MTEARTGFLVAGLGGLGNDALPEVRALYKRAGEPFPLFLAQLDTDPQPSASVDGACFMPLDRRALEAVRANPARFGPAAAEIVRRYVDFLDPEDAQNGCRTLRLLSQLSMAVYEDTLVDRLAEWVRNLRKRGAHRIQPVFVSSSGGGCGSALQVLLAQRLADPTFRQRIAEGLGGETLQTPIAFVVEPFAHAIKSARVDANNILANAFAFRVESALLGPAFKYVFHLGMANKGGTVLDVAREAAKVLGTSVYTFVREWPSIKARFVDTVDRRRLGSRYTGLDLPEHQGASMHAVPKGTGNSNGNGNGGDGRLLRDALTLEGA